MIYEILLETKTQLSQVNAIAFSKGPGNFTSIRIAANIAQSLSLSLNIPLISISTLAILAEQTWRKYKKNQVLVAIHAGKNKIYWAEYTRTIQSKWIGKKTESCINLLTLKNKINCLKEKWVLVGNVLKKIKDINLLKIKKINVLFPNAKDIIPFALLSIENKKTLTPIQIQLNYLNSIY